MCRRAEDGLIPVMTFCVACRRCSSWVRTCTRAWGTMRWCGSEHNTCFYSSQKEKKPFRMSQGRQLGADMYARLGQHEAVREALVGGGLKGRAARYAAQHGLQAAPPQPLPVLHPLVV